MATVGRDQGRRLLVLDSSYSLEAIRKKGLEASVLCRDLDGYFSEVWSVHPFASLVTSEDWTPRHGRPVATRLSARHVFIEGKIGRWDRLAPLSAVNFCLAQFDVLWQLVRLVRLHRISVVRAGDPLLLGLYGWLIARMCRIPLVVRVGGNHEKIRHETGRPIMPRFLRSVRVERAIERFVLSAADLVAAANEDNLRYAIDMGATLDKSTVFRYGNLIHPVHFVEPRRRQDGSRLLAALHLESRQFLLYIGRLEPVKMSDHVVRALAMVRSTGADVALLVVGTGSMLQELKALAEQLNVGRHVVFAGERDQEWLGQVIPRAAAVLSPHTGRALCEAALGAAPIVAYDIDWQRELIRPGVSGELVDNGDVSAMAVRAVSFINNQEWARRLGNQLRAAALEMMDPQRLDAHERAQYEDLFAGLA